MGSSSNPRNQATIQDGMSPFRKFKEDKVKGTWLDNVLSQREKRDASWFKEKVLLVQAQAEAFQTDDLDVYDSNCDDISSAIAVLMANLSSCDSDVLTEEWINCPKSWHGQFERGDKKYPTLMLEVVASYNLWIWYAFFGLAGANNVLTILNNYLLFDDILDDIASTVPFKANGVTFEKGYYIADGIYLQWATFVKSFTVARDEKVAIFKRRQENARKDVKRAFGVLQ
uniref:Protein ALP1-like isoform X1 n=1 Tax=Tanacetum cinerariifolium TaxID=118510 RepID=A0A6L2N8U8_TANCI|nr:protein ALP1-like isoform X1 [Tanacetum cinerariifolium]